MSRGSPAAPVGTVLVHAAPEPLDPSFPAEASRSLPAGTEDASSRPASTLRSSILDGIEAASQGIQAACLGAASTLALIEISDRHVRPYHVGDSVILVTGQRRKVKLQTVSHSPVGFGVEAGLIDEREAMHHAERHVVSNVVGCPMMRIEVGASLRLAPRDTLLLASDGLCDNLHIHEIIERMRCGPIGLALRDLVTEATRRMLFPRNGRPSKPDDLTVILYRPYTSARGRTAVRSTALSRRHVARRTVPDGHQDGSG